jgi:hypothetical protein
MVTCEPPDPVRGAIEATEGGRETDPDPTPVGPGGPMTVVYDVPQAKLPEASTSASAA